MMRTERSKLHSYGIRALLILLGIASLARAETVHILALHAYSQEYPWTRGQHQGFMAALNEDAKRIYDVRAEYLDTKRVNYTPEYAAELARYLREKYRGYKPDAIYVSDDNAPSFALAHMETLFSGVAVFFSGINDYGVKAKLDPTRVTGVFEKKEIAPNQIGRASCRERVS
jgi:hypothetical protein